MTTVIDPVADQPLPRPPRTAACSRYQRRCSESGVRSRPPRRRSLRHHRSPHSAREACGRVSTVCRSHITVGGGGRSQVSASIDRAFTSRGWREKKFATQIKVDENTFDSPTHKVDCFKNTIGLELEWNNKTEFYDRDLNNFRLLFELRALNVGVIVTRSDELQTIFDSLGRGASYGSTTTILSKLLRKMEGGSGGGCPVLVFGITKKLYDENC